MQSVWNEDLKWEKNVKLKVSFLLVSQPSRSCRFQSACLCLFIVICNAGDRDSRGEEWIFMWIHQHLSRHQKHTAVIMQVSLQQKLCWCQSWGRCYAISAAWTVNYSHGSPSLLLTFFSSRERNGVYSWWNKIKEDTVETFQLPDLRLVLNKAFRFGEGHCMFKRQQIWLCIPDNWKQSWLYREEMLL